MEQDYLAEVWICYNCPEHKRYRMPLSKFRKQFPFLPNSTMEGASANLLCDGCSHIRSYGSTETPPLRILDRPDQHKFVLTERVFAIELGAEDTSCESRILVFAPTGRHMSVDALQAQSKNWTLNENVRCLERKHKAAWPPRILNIREWTAELPE